MQGEQYKHSYKSEHRAVLSLCVYNAGFEQCGAGFCWGPGVRDHYLLHYVTSGFGTYTIFGETYAIGPGDLFLAYPDTEISYRADEKTPWEYYWAGFQGSEAPLLLSQTAFSVEQPVWHPADGETIKALLLDIYESRGSGIGGELRMAGRLYALFAALIEANSGGVEAGREQVRRACEYIANNFSRPISVAQIAEHTGLCRSWLYREFQRYMGVSPVRDLIQFRLLQACMLLETTALSVKSVSFSVGFEDPLYFSRAFKKQYGVSPKEYRTRHAGQSGGAFSEPGRFAENQ